MRIRRAAAVAAILAAVTGILASAAPSRADGTETLGTPSIPLASGATGIFSEGVGLRDGPGTIGVGLPASATVLQALLWWNGTAQEPDDGDGEITVNGEPVVGDLVGGPARFWRQGGRDVNSYAYRADVTSIVRSVAPAGDLVVSDVDFPFATNGATLTVLFAEPGEAPLDVSIVDGLDIDFDRFPGDRGRIEPQTFVLEPRTVPRVASIDLAVGSVSEPGGPPRPNVVDISVDGVVTTFTDPFSGTDGAEWDTMTFTVDVPPGATTIVVHPQSVENEAGDKPASLEWVMAAVAATGENPCVVDPERSRSHGSAYNLHVAVPGLGLDTNRINLVEAAVDGVGDETDAIGPASLVDITVGEALGTAVSDALGLSTAQRDLVLVSADVLESATIADNLPTAATDRSRSVLADVSLLGDLLTADAIVAATSTSATDGGSDASTFGSRIDHLTVNDPTGLVPNLFADQLITFGTTIPVPGIGEVAIYDRTLAESDNTTKGPAAATVDMIRLTIDLDLAALPDPLPGILADLEPLLEVLDLIDGATIIVGHADSFSEFGANLCEPGAGRGRVDAYANTLRVEGVAGLGPIRAAYAGPIPWFGGEDFSMLNGLHIGSSGEIASSGTGVAAANGGHDGEAARADAHVTVQALSALDVILGGPLVDGSLVSSEAHAVDDGTKSSSGSTTIADLTISGIDVCTALGFGSTVCTPEPNTPFTAGLGLIDPDLELVSITLNWQTNGTPASMAPSVGCAGTPGSTGQCTVQAIRLQLSIPSNPLTVLDPIEVVVSESHAGAQK